MFSMKESTKIKLSAGLVRAGRTFLQAFISALGFTGAESVATIDGLTWGVVLKALLVGLGSAVVAVAMSMKTLPEVADAVEEAKDSEAKVEEAMAAAKEAVEKEIAIEKAVDEAAQAKVDEGLEIAKEAVKDEVIAKIEAEVEE